MADEKFHVHDHGEGGPPEGKDQAQGKLNEFLASGQRLSEEEKAKKNIKVFSKQQIREFVLKLIDELAGKSCADHIKEIYQLREQLEGLSRQAAKEIDGLKAQRDHDLEDLRKEFNDLIAQMKIDHENELNRLRESAAEGVRDRLAQLEKELEIERGRAADLDARLAAALAEIERLNLELAALKKALDSAELRSRAELLKIIAELEAKIHELELGLDYFDLEEEIDTAAFTARVEAVLPRLQGSDALATAARKALADALDAGKKFDALRQMMNENKASIGVVVDMVKMVKDAQSAAARVGVAEQAMPG
jgi:DNA repair exonuclease SbcCD ATPase subunit